MDNLEFVLKATKIIVENCVKAKFEFANQVKAYFQTHKILSDPIVKLPKKRVYSENKAVSSSNPKKKLIKKPKICKKKSSSSSESEIEYNDTNFSKISKISLFQVKTIDDELNEVFSSDDCSLFNTDTDDDSTSEANYITSYENVFECLDKREGNVKTVLNQFNRLLDSFELVQPMQKKVCKEIICRILGLDLKVQDKGVEKLFIEVWNKGKQVIENFVVTEDWEKVLKEVNEAARMDDKERVKEILLRIENGFPESLNNKVHEQIKPLIKQVGIVARTWMAGETKDSACRIMGMWNKLTQFLEIEKNAKMAEILTQFKFLDTENNLNQSWNQNLVIKNKNKRK